MRAGACASSLVSQAEDTSELHPGEAHTLAELHPDSHGIISRIQYTYFLTFLALIGTQATRVCVCV